MDRESVIAWLLIVGIIAAVLYARQKGKARFNASIAAAKAEARVDFAAELESFASAAAQANVSVVNHVAAGAVPAGLDAGPTEADLQAWLRVARAGLGGTAARGLVVGRTSDDSSTYYRSDDEYPAGDDGDSLYGAVARTHGYGGERKVPVDRNIGGRDSGAAALDVATGSGALTYPEAVAHGMRCTLPANDCAVCSQFYEDPDVGEAFSMIRTPSRFDA